MSPARAEPRFSICLPVWQRSGLVQVAIEGALAQSLTQWGLIVGETP